LIELNTDRLRILPLELKQFKLLLTGMDEMEKELGLICSGEVMDEHTKKAMEGLYQDALKNNENYIWYTNWQIVLKSENISIGSACFMRCPNESGEVEVGYGINAKYQNNGYMTEALKSMCNWALNQPNVVCVIAETEKGNIPSHRTLQKTGMKMYKETDDGFWWKLEK